MKKLAERIRQGGCKWCGTRCVGTGYLNPGGAGDPCGVRRHLPDVDETQDDASHACEECGAYCCAIHCLDGGVCPDCGDPEEAQDTLGQRQDIARLLATDDGEPGGCSSDVKCALTAGEPEPPAMEWRRR